MKSVEFLIDSRHQAKKLVISTPEKGGSTWSCIIFSNKNFYPKLHIIKMFKKFPFQKYILLQRFKLRVIGNFVGLTDEIGKLCRPNLFSVPVKNIENLIFKLHKSAICRKTNFFGTFWLFFLISMVI